jgi:selenocysteine lyase/cysteine desulfurase
MVVFRAPGGHDQELDLLGRLNERKIAVNVRWMKGQGGLRASIHAMNSREDVARLLAALRELLRG